MHDARGEMHYIATDLDSRAWIDAGLAKLEDYLASWRLFGERQSTRPSVGKARGALSRSAPSPIVDLLAWAALALRVVRP